MTGTTEILTIEEAHRLVVAALIASNTAPENAAPVADALVAAEIDGQKGHGLSRVPSYAAQAKSGKVDGHATPTVTSAGRAGIRVDAAHGFAFPAFALAHDTLAQTVATTGIAAAAVFRSHHFGQAGYHVEKLAEKGLIGLVFGNSPQAIAPWGGTTPIFGTNPIAFAAPRRAEAPLVIDLSLAKVARGKVMVAKQKGETIPDDWALDADGNPTTDPDAALAGSMLPMGGAKGAALVLMVEILAAALTGAQFGFEASSFFDADGPPPAVGQFLLAIDPAGFSGGAFADRLEALLAAILAQEGTRIPGTKRLANRAKCAAEGLAVDAALLRTIRQMVG